MPTRLRILLVDDEPRVLDGLRRTLHTLRQEFETVFVTSGPLALERLAAEPFDVVLSDIRMPGMDGVELLSEIRRSHPGVVRLALSGQSEKEAVLKATGPIQSYLSKPCEPEALKLMLIRLRFLRSMVPAEDMREAAAQMDGLPIWPEASQRFLECLQASEPTTADLAAVAAQDLGLTMKILQLANSGFFDHRRYVAEPLEALRLIGLETLRGLAHASTLFAAFDVQQIEPELRGQVQAHSQRVAVCARRLAQAAGASEELAQLAWLAGRLHDAGQMVLAARRPEAYRQARELARAENLETWVAEKRCLGASHAEVGAYLLGLWGAPEVVVRAVAGHHRPAECDVAEVVLTATHVANHCVCAGERGASPLDEVYLAHNGWTGQAPAWRALCAAALAEMPGA